MRDAVENLANAYIRIKSEGCIQLDNMKIVVHCNFDDDAAIEITFQSIQQTLTGYKTEKNALQHCQCVTAYLRSCIEKWRKIMAVARRYICLVYKFVYSQN